MEDREQERRVRLCEDGVYRWTYSIDMWHSAFIFGPVMKIFFWIALAIGLFVGMAGSWRSTPGWVMGLVFFGGTLVLWPLIYVIWALCARGVTRMFFVMDDECIAQTSYTQKARDVNSALTAVMLVAGVATGNTGRALGTATRVNRASQDSTTYFSGVKGIVEKRDREMIVLKNLITRCRLLVPPEDYDLVLNHVRDHVPAWVLDDKTQDEYFRGRRMRLWIAAAASLILNGITVPINLASYRATGYLKIAWNVLGGDYGQQRAFALLVDDWYFRDPVEHHLSFSPVYAVVCLLAVFLVVWLALVIVAAIRRKREK